MCQHVTLHVADAAKFIPSSICISTRMSYVRPRLSLTARNIASHHLTLAKAKAKVICAASRSRRPACARIAPTRGSPCLATLASSTLSLARSASVRHHGQAVISLGQPRFVTHPAPFPFPDLHRQPLAPALRQVPEHPAALPHWPSPLAPATIGEEALAAPSTWFRSRGVLLAHPRHPGTAMVRERREIFLKLS